MVYFVRKKLILNIILIIVEICNFVYGEEKNEDLFLPPKLSNEETSITPEDTRISSLLELLNKKTCIPLLEEETKKKEKERLREDWKNLLNGIDIFYPYFKMKEIEEWLGEKFKLEIFNFKGKPKLEGDEAFYIFKLKL